MTGRRRLKGKRTRSWRLPVELRDGPRVRERDLGRLNPRVRAANTIHISILPQDTVARRRLVGEGLRKGPMPTHRAGSPPKGKPRMKAVRMKVVSASRMGGIHEHQRVEADGARGLLEGGAVR